MKLAVIILNYNDRPHTEKLARKVAGFSLVSLVVIVDNQSTDGSGEELADYFRHAGKVAVIRTSRNGGYGYGNNAGLRYACGQGCTHMLIANPDTDFTEDMLRKLCEVFVKKRDAGVVSAMMLDSQHGLQQTAWPLRSFTQDLINAGPLARRLLGWSINYPKSKFRSGVDLQKNPGDQENQAVNRNQIIHPVRVGVVHGSLLMSSREAFEKTGGYDEKVFLYSEENILARRLQMAGFATYVVPEALYHHENSGTISKTYHSMVLKQKLRQESEMYYYEAYLHIGLVRKLIAKLCQSIVMFETKALDKMLEMKAKLMKS